MTERPRVAIIGNGRFGRTWCRCLGDEFERVIYDEDPAAFHGAPHTAGIRVARDLDEVYACKTIFFAVPIRRFAAAIEAAKPYLRDHLLIDLLSVKLYPAAVLTEALAETRVEALLTHPVFGPDSARAGFAGQRIVVDRFRTSAGCYAHWVEVFARCGLEVIEMSAQEHDQLAAKSQALTHLVGRLLAAVDFAPTAIDTVGAHRLQEVQAQVSRDSWDLFQDLQTFNPYVASMRAQVGAAYERLCRELSLAYSGR